MQVTHPARSGLVALIAILAGLFLAAPSQAQDLSKLETGLRLLPADTGFAVSSMRHKEVCEIIGKSNAWKKLWNLPIVQKGWNEFDRNVLKSPDFQQFMADPQNQDLVKLLTDAVSDEVFVAGSDGWVSLLNVGMEVYSSVFFETIQAAISKRKPNEMEMGRMAMNTLSQNKEKLHVPDLLFSFKVKDPKRLDAQLDRLEALFKMAEMKEPKIKGRLERKKINDGSFLVFSLDGAMIPWDEIPWQNLENNPGEFAPLVNKIKGLKGVVCLGHQQGHLMFAISASTQYLSNLGAPGPNVLTQPEFAPLAKYADRPLTSISFVSKKVIAMLNAAGDYSEFVQLAKDGLPALGVPEAQAKNIIKDLEKFASEITPKRQEFGGGLQFTFLTPRGYETFAYDFTPTEDHIGVKPLTILKHVGGNPILAFAGREKVDGASYAFVSKWAKIAWGHVDEFARNSLEGDIKDMYAEGVKVFLPLVKRFDDITTKEFIPSLADGQRALVIDAKWKSKQWIGMLPPTEKDMPMLELGLVLGVSDALKLEKAMGDYRTLINDMIDAGIKLSGIPIPGVQIPAPEFKDGKNGKLYFYSLPFLLGVDGQVAPTAGLSKNVAALTLSNEHSERLLASTPLKQSEGPLAKADRPLRMAIVFDFPELLNAVSPWADFAANKIIDQQVQNGSLREGERVGILEQVHTVIEVLSVYRGTTAATYYEGGKTVTHFESVIRDLAK